jgi:hypothetical protein
MATIFSKIISGVMVAASSVLSIIAPPIGVPLLGLSVGVASKTFGTDPVSNSGQVVATGQTQQVAQSVINTSAQTQTLLNKNAAYQSYLNQGYTPAQAASLSGLPTNAMGLPSWLLYGGIGVIAIVVLKKLHIL